MSSYDQWIAAWRAIGRSFFLDSIRGRAQGNRCTACGCRGHIAKRGDPQSCAPSWLAACDVIAHGLTQREAGLRHGVSGSSVGQAIRAHRALIQSSHEVGQRGVHYCSACGGVGHRATKGDPTRCSPSWSAAQEIAAGRMTVEQAVEAFRISRQAVERAIRKTGFQ